MPESVVGFFTHLLDPSGFAPRWQCGVWPAELGWLHIASDSAIFFAYAAIPASLALFLLRRRDVPLRGIYWLFVAFILSCGITHLIDASMFYYPMYRLLGLMKFITAVVSLVTVIALVRIMPVALGLPNILRAHRDAEAELAERRAAQEKLLAARAQLEERGSQLTVRDRRMRRAMAAAHAGAVAWEIETGTLLWEVGVSPLLLAEGHAFAANWTELIGAQGAAVLRDAARAALNNREQLVLEIPVALASGKPGVIRIRAHAEAAHQETPAEMAGLVGIIAE